MTRMLEIAVIVGALITMTGCQDRDAVTNPAQPVENSTTQPTTNSGFAVVELFTSEGCSSCPPAEAVLAKIDKMFETDGRRVFALAFHVDYWNNLGWADPFSNAANSRRQSQYGKALDLDQIYTPQMIVNGKIQFVGSDQAKADQAIEAALKTSATSELKLSISLVLKGKYKVSYLATGATADDVVNLAIIERGLVSQVKRGENAGRTLNDPNVVRWFESQTVPDNGRGEFVLPSLPDVHVERASVIAYIQNPKDMAVLGAVSAEFPR